MAVTLSPRGAVQFERRSHRLIFRFSIKLDQAGVGHAGQTLRVDFGALEAAVAEQLLHQQRVVGVVVQPGRERVPQCVELERLAEQLACQSRGRPLELGAMYLGPCAGEQKPWAGTVGTPVEQSGHQGVMQGDGAGEATLERRHVQDAASDPEMIESSAAHLADTQTVQANRHRQ